MLRALKIVAFCAVAGFCAVSLWAMQAAPDPAPATYPVQPYSGTALMITTIAGFASLLATHLFQLLREKRNRRWDLEDRAANRAAMREELKRSADTQRVETIQTAIELARVSNINREHIVGELKKNTDITSDARAKAENAEAAASAVALSVDERLAQLHKELVGLREATGVGGKKEGQ